VNVWGVTSSPSRGKPRGTKPKARPACLLAAPKDMPYEDCPRGRVNRFDATGRFTLLADRCIIKSKPLLSEIMAGFGLPKGTAVMRDLHYRCAACMGKVPTREQEKEDWDF